MSSCNLTLILARVTTLKTGGCVADLSFPYTCRLLFNISKHKLVVSHNFLSIRIVLSCFHLLIFYFEKFSTWICSRFAVFRIREAETLTRDPAINCIFSDFYKQNWKTLALCFHSLLYPSLSSVAVTDHRKKFQCLNRFGTLFWEYNWCDDTFVF